MTYDEMMENIKNEKYKPVHEEVPPILKVGYVFDREMSVAWNEQQVLDNNKVSQAISMRNWEAYSNASKLFMNDLMQYIKDDCVVPLNDLQADAMAGKAYSEGHSGGYYEVLNEAQELIAFVEDFVKLGK